MLVIGSLTGEVRWYVYIEVIYCLDLLHGSRGGSE
jgi:hypothetical protein